ncbi:MAG: cell division protein SepF [Clostridia bacterium]|nr:cell division protein SepF [Clostridia bacterium]MBQ6614450.1 cell division protein SepF [Clostridia bacterium]
MGFFGDIKDRLTKDTYEDNGYVYDDADESVPYYDDVDADMNVNDGAATIGGSGYDIMGGGSAIELKVVKPQSFEDCAQVADHLLSKRTVVLNLEDTNKEAARRILDFLTGVAYSIGGNIKKVANSAYVVTPSNVDVSEGQIKQKAQAPVAEEAAE